MFDLPRRFVEGDIRMKRFKILMVTAAVFMLLTACGNPEDTLVKNSWVWESSRGSDVLEFYDDGTYDWGGWGSGTYSVKDDKLKLDRKYMSTYTYIFEIDGDTLTLSETDGSNVFTLTKE